jgi:hypothetical protein
MSKDFAVGFDNE